MGVREDMPVESGLRGCIWWCLLSWALAQRKQVSSTSIQHTQTMAAGGTCHAQSSEQMYLEDLLSKKLETSYFIYPERCCALLASAWAFGPSNIVITSQIIKSKNVSWEMTRILSLLPYKEKNQKEPTKYFKTSHPTTATFHQYLSIVTGDITANRLAQMYHQANSN